MLCAPCKIVFTKGLHDRQAVSCYNQAIQSGLTHEASVNLLWTTRNLASLGALRAQIPTEAVSCYNQADGLRRRLLTSSSTYTS